MHFMLWAEFNIRKEVCTAAQTNEHVPLCLLSFPHQLSFVFAEFPMRFVLNSHLQEEKHILHNVKGCGKDMCHFTSTDE